VTATALTQQDEARETEPPLRVTLSAGLGVLLDEHGKGGVMNGSEQQTTAAERDKMVARLEGLVAGLDIAIRTVEADQRLRAMRAYQPASKRDGIDRIMSVLTFGVW
jgi:hypothetical protein